MRKLLRVPEDDDFTVQTYRISIWCASCLCWHPWVSVGNKDWCENSKRVGDFHPDGDFGGVPEAGNDS